MSESPMVKEPTGRASPAVDRISNLPTIITDNILKRVPLRDAVRTSILSKDWRHKWLTLPDLVFDPKFTSSLRGSWNPEFIIDCILLRHEGPILKFEVVEIIGSYDAFECWLHFLLKHHHIEDLRLWYLTHIGLFVPWHPQTACRPMPSEVLFSFDCLQPLKDLASLSICTLHSSELNLRNLIQCFLHVLCSRNWKWCIVRTRSLGSWILTFPISSTSTFLATSVQFLLKMLQMLSTFLFAVLILDHQHLTILNYVVRVGVKVT